MILAMTTLSLTNSPFLSNLQMTSFASFVESKPAMDEQLSKVEHYTVMLCDALYLDIKRQTLRWHENALKSSDSDTEYHKNKVMQIYNEGVDHEFYIESGRKYYKVIHQSGAGGSRSVHCFVDKKTGDVYKSASWKAPAKGVRYNLLNETSREECYARADWAGGYLYQR
jgi:hypothetical protein